ncbi:MAG TPA: metallophosphoesterase [Sphingomicrobium sp.]|nr:metallophosphoesterase [Sphingomicrobium sp.]
MLGDVHGRLDLLDEMLGRIEADDQSRAGSKTSVIFLGDLIDRGPDSAGVLHRLMHYRPAFATPYFIAGNHEEVLLRILDGDSGPIANWLTFGGAECARSYGLDPEDLRLVPAGEAVEHLRRAVPEAHWTFLRNFADSVTFGSYLMVHAGIRPGIALDSQTPRDLRWIRSPFLEADGDLGFTVVHGHTISESVEIRSNRIGIDTGAYATGVLTALVLEGTSRSFLQTAGAPSPQARFLAAPRILPREPDRRRGSA